MLGAHRQIFGLLRLALAKSLQTRSGSCKRPLVIDTYVHISISSIGIMAHVITFTLIKLLLT